MLGVDLPSHTDPGDDRVPDRVQHVRFVAERQPAGRALDQPAVMIEPGVRRVLDAGGLLDDPRRHFDVAGFGYPVKFRADPDRVPHVFEQMRADGEVEELVRERPGLVVAQVKSAPRVLAIAGFLLDVERAERSAAFVGQGVNDVVGPREWPRASADVYHAGLGGQFSDQTPRVF